MLPGRVLGIEVGLAIENRNRDRDREVFRARDNNPLASAEFRSGFERIAKMEAKYQAMKRALRDKDDEDGHDFSLSLAKDGFADRLKEIADK